MNPRPPGAPSHPPRYPSGSLTRQAIAWLCLLWLALPHPTRGAATLHLGPASGLPGSDVRLSVLLDSSTPVVAAAFDIVHESPYVELQPVHRGSAAPNHRVRSATPSAGRQRLVVYSLTNAALPPGPIVDLVLRLQPSSPDVTATLGVTNVQLVAANGSDVIPQPPAPGSVAISALRFDSVQRHPDGRVELQLRGRAEDRYVIQAAPTADALLWSNLSTNVATNGVIRIQDPAGRNATGRFYRAIAAP